MKTELWNGREIRFVYMNYEWWAVLSDIADALSLKSKYMKKCLDDEVV